MSAAVRGIFPSGDPTEELGIEGIRVPVHIREYWTSRQRAANRLHEVSYRACFKPQLPAYFISRLTHPRSVVYDPFMGRGTTLVEAALQGRIPWGNDANPLSTLLTRPRLRSPALKDVEERVRSMDLDRRVKVPSELRVFYHPDTLREIVNLRNRLLRDSKAGRLDAVDDWIRMVAINRLTGHSPGFFSVYTLPPNQATSVASQARINERRNQVPPRRSVPDLILRKSRALLADLSPQDRARIRSVEADARLLTMDASATSSLPSGSVSLVVTSPPFLDIVDYVQDNWLRNWFSGIPRPQLRLTQARTLPEWERKMTSVFLELARLLTPDGIIAFEVGEVRNRTIRLEESVIRCALNAGLAPRGVLVNDQAFTKTSNCWGVSNGERGTNTNRVVVLSRENA